MASVSTKAIPPRMARLNSTEFTRSVRRNTGNPTYYPTIDANNNLMKVADTATVTVSDSWAPEAYFGGMTLTSTPVMPMSN
jgi:hypothetical protein